MTSQISADDVRRLAQIVREETGNQVLERNYPMIESRMRARLLSLGLDSMTDFWRHFRDQEASERVALQSLMTTHHTFFFREFVHFGVLQSWIDENAARLKARGRPLRVWSAACSRGQEAYSLAMFLQKTLVDAHQCAFEIIGTDIDAQSVAHAANGVYALKEVNTIPQTYLKGNWRRGTGAVKDFAAAAPAMKAQVRFEVLNLLEQGAWRQGGKFDVIFCRNVFIYFSPADVRKIAFGLLDRLEPKGLLVSGVSEPLRFPDWPLSLIGPSCHVSPSEIESPNAPDNGVVAAVGDLRADLTASRAPWQNVKYRVLCVDDSPTIQALMRRIFTQDPDCAFFDVAGNGREAREKLDKEKFDLITLDIHMPEVNGIEFLEKLYRLKQDPPVLMVSSVNRTDVEFATKAIKLGAFDYVEKPAANTLQKSADEILIKGKLARRTPTRDIETAQVGEFDASIAQRIVVADASRCLRIVWSSDHTLKQLRQIIEGQAKEYRSPATLIIWRGAQLSRLEADLLGATSRQISSWRDAKQALRPNHVYLLERDLTATMLPHLKQTTVSLQVLDDQLGNLEHCRRTSPVQILIDENLSGMRHQVETKMGAPVSEVTPATSFPSLSVEFFANLRSAAA